MSNVLRLAIVDPNDSARDHLKSTLLGMDMVWLEAECSRYEFFADVVAQTHPDIGISSPNCTKRRPRAAFWCSALPATGP
jgi:pilus assembly protein CpaE